MGRAVVHYEIQGRDGAKLREFYRALFDWDATIVDPDNRENYALIDRDQNLDLAGNGLSGAIAQVPSVLPASWRGPSLEEGFAGGVTVFVAVPDVETALQQAEQLGGSRLLGPDPLFPGVEMGRFADPEGHTIGVITETIANGGPGSS